MKLKGRVDVEPLGDARWAKIARALFERVAAEATAVSTPSPALDDVGRSRRGRLRSAALAAAAVMVIALAGWALARGAPPSFEADRPSHIVTGQTGSMLVVGANSLAVSPDSEVVVSGSDDRGVLAVVERGRVTFSVAPRHGRPPFVVQAGEVGIRVIGTRFAVTRIGEGAGVQVDHGIVEVTAAGATTLVHQGESWPSGWSSREGAPAVPTREPAPPVDAAPGLDPQGGPITERTRRVIADGDRSSGPSARRVNPSSVSGDPGPVVPVRLAAAPRATSTGDLPDVPTAGVLPAFIGFPGTAPASALNDATDPVLAPAVQASATPMVTAAPPATPAATAALAASTFTAGHAPDGDAPSAQDRFERAERLERTDAVRALALYRGLAAESGPWAMNALFAAARMQLVRGSHGEGRTLLTEYLRRYPQGPNAGDARRLLGHAP